MSFSSNITDVVTRIGLEFKTVRTELTTTTGKLSDLSTTAKSNLVAAINELEAAIEAANESALGINDSAASTTTTYSSSKVETELAKKADVGHRHDNATTTVDGFMSSADKTKLDSVAAGAAAIDDTSTTSTTKTWSANQITLAITAAKDELTDGAGAALDTLKELADALGNDANFATTVSTALAKRVRVDAAQAFTDAEKLQARENIGAVSAADVGDIDTDYVAVFETALV